MAGSTQTITVDGSGTQLLSLSTLLGGNNDFNLEIYRQETGSAQAELVQLEEGFLDYSPGVAGVLGGWSANELQLETFTGGANGARYFVVATNPAANDGLVSLGALASISITTTASTRTDYNVTTPTVSGNVVTNDDGLGQAVTVTAVDGNIVSGSTTIIGGYGTLVIDSNGAYAYTPFKNIGVIGQTDNFEYVIDDGNGNTDTATLTVAIGSDFPAVNFDVDAVNDIAGTTLIVNPLITTETVTGVSANGSHAKPVTTFEIDEGNTGSVVINAVGGGGLLGSGSASIQLQLEGADGGFTTVGTSSNASLSVNGLAAGTYRIQGTIDDGVIITTTTGRFNATVTQTNPSMPGLYDSVAATGNIIDDNDIVTPSTVVSIVNSESINASGMTSIDGQYGTLLIDSDGTYTYTPDPNINVINQVDEFEYTILDDYGNTDTATLAINITSAWPAPASVSSFSMNSFTFADDDAIELPDTLLSISSEGLDILSFEGADQIISLADLIQPDVIDISGIGSNTLNVAAKDVDSAIYVKGDNDDTVNLEGDSWSTVGQTTLGMDVYDVWQSVNDSSTQIYIDTTVHVI